MEKELFIKRTKEIASQLESEYIFPDEMFYNHMTIKKNVSDVGLVEFSIRNDDYQNKKKFHLCSHFARTLSGELPYSSIANHTEISFTETKNLDQMIKDIKKRFLPSCLEETKKANDWIKDSDKSTNARIDLMELASQIVNKSVWSQNKNKYYNNGRGRISYIEYKGDRIDANIETHIDNTLQIEIKGINLQELQKIHDILK